MEVIKSNNNSVQKISISTENMNFTSYVNDKSEAVISLFVAVLLVIALMFVKKKKRELSNNITNQ